MICESGANLRDVRIDCPPKEDKGVCLLTKCLKRKGNKDIRFQLSDYMRHQSFATVVFFTICFFAAFACTEASAQVKRERGSRFIVPIGAEAPCFQFVTSEGDTLDSDILRGQVVVLQFAASWCPFSQAQLIDHKKYIWDRYRDRDDLSMFIICEDIAEDRPTFLRQREENGIDIPYVFDEGEEIYRLFVTPNGSVTRTVIIDKSWKIADLHDMHTLKDLFEIRRMVRKLSK